MAAAPRPAIQDQTFLFKALGAALAHERVKLDLEVEQNTLDDLIDHPPAPEPDEPVRKSKRFASNKTTSADLVQQALSSGVVPFVFRWQNDTTNTESRASIGANATVGQVRQLIERNFFAHVLPCDQAVFIVENITISIESTDRSFLEQVLLLYAISQKPLMLPIHVHVGNRHELAFLERKVNPKPKFGKASTLGQLLVHLCKPQGASPFAPELSFGPYSLFDWKTNTAEAEKEATKLKTLLPKSTAGVTNKTHESLKMTVDFCDHPELILPMLIAMNITKRTVADLREWAHPVLGVPVGIQSESSSLVLAEYCDILTLEKLGVARGSICHIYWTARGKAAEAEQSAMVTTLPTTTPIDSETNTIVDFNWCLVSIPPSTAKSRNLVKQLTGEEPNVAENAKDAPVFKLSVQGLSSELLPVLVEDLPSLDKHGVRGRIMLRHAAEKSDEAITVTIMPTDPKEQKFTIQVLPSFNIDIVRDAIHWTKSQFLPQGMHLFTKGGCEEYQAFSNLEKTLADYNISSSGATIQFSYHDPTNDQGAGVVSVNANDAQKDDQNKTDDKDKKDEARTTIPVAYAPGIHAPVLHLSLHAAEETKNKSPVFAEDEKPSLIVSEPDDYFCSESHVIGYYDVSSQVWEEGMPFVPSDDGNSVSARIGHFGTVGILSTRLTKTFTYGSDYLAPRFNYDFSDIDDSGNNFVRGGLAYARPCGYMRYATAVSGLFDNGNDAWLDTGANAWPVAYHGTTLGKAMDIVAQGMRRPTSNRAPAQAKTGCSIYLSRDPIYAARYATPVNVSHNGHTYKVSVILQSRVKPLAWASQAQNKASNSDTEWLFEDPTHIRFYGICVKVEQK